MYTSSYTLYASRGSKCTPSCFDLPGLLNIESYDCSDSGSSIKHSSIDAKDDLSSTSNISTSDEDDMRLHHDSKKEEVYEPVNKVLRKE